MALNNKSIKIVPHKRTDVHVNAGNARRGNAKVEISRKMQKWKTQVKNKEKNTELDNVVVETS